MALRIYKVIQNVLLIGVLAAFTGLISMIVILDMNPYVVVSGSMEPALPVGSVCIVDCQQRSPDEGDIISYKAGEGIVTHRVIDVIEDYSLEDVIKLKIAEVNNSCNNTIYNGVLISELILLKTFCKI